MLSQTFVFIGRSGCGKGTQAELLGKELAKLDSSRDVFYLETGQRFRDFIAAPGYSNSLAKSIQENGNLQPAFLSVWIWSDILIEKLNGTQHLIIDGTPRKLGEAIIFNEAMKFYGRKPIIVYVNVSRKWSEERLLSRHRSDDKMDIVAKRLDWFDTDVLPAVEYFRNHDDVAFLDINGEQTIEAVHNEIMKKLGW